MITVNKENLLKQSFNFAAAAQVIFFCVVVLIFLIPKRNFLIYKWKTDQGRAESLLRLYLLPA